LFPAWLATLAHFDERGTEAEPVTDTNVVLGQAARRDILTEGTRRIEQRMRADLLGPPVIMITRIMVNGFFRPAMHAEIGLLVAFNPEQVNGARARHRRFADRARFVRGQHRDAPGQQRFDGPAHEYAVGGIASSRHPRRSP